MSDTLNIGDKIVVDFGPYLASATVVNVTDRGAVLEYADDAKLHTAMLREVTAPDGTVLAAEGFGFVGKAHFHEYARRKFEEA